jgi:hypothetical protein
MTSPLTEDASSNPNTDQSTEPHESAELPGGALKSILHLISRIVTKPGPEEVLYYAPPGSCKEAQALLEREDLSEQDVLDFVHDRELRELPQVEGHELRRDLLDAYHKRRREILELGKKLWKNPPEAYIDEDGRLVPVTDHDENNMLGELPPLPDRHGNNNNNNDNDNLFGRGNNNDNANDAGMNNFPLGINNNNNIPFPLDQEEEERRWLEQEEREAELAIARAVQRYHKQGVPEEEYVLLKVPLAERPERASLTFRRICFAVLAVVTAFVCIMLQTLPLFPFDSRPDPVFDKLLYELAEVRHFPEHALACPGLHRSPLPPQPWTSRLKFWESREEILDCSDGVLHIPAKSVLIGAFYESSTDREASFWKSHVRGVNVSWFLPCNPPHNDSARCQAQFPEESCQAPQDPTDDTGSAEPPNARCFRGIHDNIITDLEIGDVLQLGADLIHDGGDHFDIHDNVFLLQDRLPTLVNSIRNLLRDTYMVQRQVQPVAFRINAVGPFDGTGVALRGAHSQTSSLLRLFNRQVSLGSAFLLDICSQPWWRESISSNFSIRTTFAGSRSTNDITSSQGIPSHGHLDRSPSVIHAI